MGPKLHSWLRPFQYVPFEYAPNILTFFLVYARWFIACYILATLFLLPSVLQGTGASPWEKAFAIMSLAFAEEMARYQFSRRARSLLIAFAKFALIINVIEVLGALIIAISDNTNPFVWFNLLRDRTGAVILHFVLSGIMYAMIGRVPGVYIVLGASALHASYNYFSHQLIDAIS